VTTSARSSTRIDFDASRSTSRADHPAEEPPGSGTRFAERILKFYLHISKDEQLKRFADRLEEPDKRWKISESDYKERKLWGDYTTAYEDALSRCSTDHAPWFVIPSDHKWFRNLAIARIVVEHLEGLHLKFPKPSVNIEHIRREYHAAKER
jgi:hypothetical protein